MDFSTWTLPQDVWRELVADFDGDELVDNHILDKKNCAVDATAENK